MLEVCNTCWVRLQVAEISTPQVRPIPAAELELRAAAGAAYAAAAREAAASGAQPDVRALPAEYADFLGGGGGSSSEDTSDEAYAARHKAGQEEERARFLGAGGEWSISTLVLSPSVALYC